MILYTGHNVLKDFLDSRCIADHRTLFLFILTKPKAYSLRSSTNKLRAGKDLRYGKKKRGAWQRKGSLFKGTNMGKTVQPVQTSFKP